MPIVNFTSNANYRLNANAAVTTQNIAGNYTDVYWRFWLFKAAGSGYWSSAAPGNRIAASIVDANGVEHQLIDESGFEYDFTEAVNTQKFFRSGTFRVYHKPDGTGSYSFVTSSSLVSLGSALASTGTRTLARIPRGPRVKHGGVWRNTVAYVKVSGVWRIALPYVKSGTWKING